MQKTPYTGDKLRIDGYYYSNPYYENQVSIAVFYRDGFCIHTRIISKSGDILSDIENEILLNNKYISELKNDPCHIGVFHVINPYIEFEVWEYRSWTFTYFGEIVNDTTFIINKWVNNRTKETSSENLTYRFKQFSPKPDSTNVWIK
jgi:hypothetical protein